MILYHAIQRRLLDEEEEDPELTEMFALVRAAREDSRTALIYSPGAGRGISDMVVVYCIFATTLVVVDCSPL